jgi:uncharacterized protein with NAD-binding domain and iron-sulfur cluster
MAKKVVVLGGGVAGMSAAHELVERGFEVEVFERQLIPGGKARSIPVTEPFVGRSPVGGRAFDSAHYRSRKPWLPGEHGFRFFPGFYRHVVETMARIPYRDGKSVADNLVNTSVCQLARFDRPASYVPARFPRSPEDLKAAVGALVDLLGGQMEVNLEETAFFAGKLWQVMTSCDDRRFKEYEAIAWWDFIEAEQRSAAYQKVFGNVITRSLVAAKAEWASTRTIANVFLQFVFDILDPSVATSDRVLNGPTNDVWIHPWLEYLRSRGVQYHLGTAVVSLRVADGAVAGATVSREGKTWEVHGDYYVAALPVERMAKLVTPELLALDPALGHLEALGNEYVEWMNGIQYYLTRDVTITHGHTVYVDSPWALTSVSQAQFWRDFDLSEYGDGLVRGILSVDISDWDVPGLNGKEADRCTRREIAEETWRQLKRSLNVSGVEVLRDEDLHFWYLDPGILDVDPEPGIEINEEPLLVNYEDTWGLRPTAITKVKNLFLASDYVQTHTDLATMEAANEAARRAVNGVLEACGSSAAPCGVWPFHEPEALSPLRAYDQTRFDAGLPWDGRSLDLADAARKLLTVLGHAGATQAPTDIGLERRIEQDLSELIRRTEARAEPPAEVPRGPGSSATTPAPTLPALRIVAR